MNKYKRLEYRAEALEKELRKTAVLLGKAEKREKAKDEEIRRLQRSERTLEKLYFAEKRKIDDIQAKEQETLKQLSALSEYTKGRMVYLMIKYTGGVFDERGYSEWIKGKEFAISPESEKDKSGKVKIVAWRADVRNVEGEGYDRAERPAAQNEKTGGGENRRTDEQKN